MPFKGKQPLVLPFHAEIPTLKVKNLKAKNRSKVIKVNLFKFE